MYEPSDQFMKCSPQLESARANKLVKPSFRFCEVNNTGLASGFQQIPRRQYHVMCCCGNPSNGVWPLVSWYVVLPRAAIAQGYFSQSGMPKQPIRTSCQLPIVATTYQPSYWLRLTFHSSFPSISDVTFVRLVLSLSFLLSFLSLSRSFLVVLGQSFFLDFWMVAQQHQACKSTSCKSIDPLQLEIVPPWL